MVSNAVRVYTVKRSMVTRKQAQSPSVAATTFLNILNMKKQFEGVGVGGTIKGTVVGLKRIEIKNVADIKCPICGEPMQITQVSSEYDTNAHEVITGINSFVDGASTRHRIVYGREVTETEHPIYLSCANKCAEVKIKLTNVSVGFDKVLRREVLRS